MCRNLIKMLKQHDVSVEDITLDHGFLLQLEHTFTVDTRVLPKVIEGK